MLKKVSTSFISGVKWNRNNPAKLQELCEGKWGETTPEQQKGIDFETDLAFLNGNYTEERIIAKDEWYDNKMKILEQIKGSVWQEQVKKVIEINGERYLLKGFIDFYKAGDTIFDIKTTKHYIEGEMKFIFSTQHLIYLWCKGETKFKYLINSWDNPKKVFEETYHYKENYPQRLASNIETCETILKQYGLSFPEVEDE